LKSALHQTAATALLHRSIRSAGLYLVLAL